MKLLLEDVRKNVDVLLKQLESGREVIVTRAGESIILQDFNQLPSKKPLPDLTDFRKSLNLQGEPLSQTVTELRKNYGY
ncbi:MAG: hypothetical protein ACRCYY_07300 [Trueperaceae bacterium]